MHVCACVLAWVNKRVVRVCVRVVGGVRVCVWCGLRACTCVCVCVRVGGGGCGVCCVCCVYACVRAWVGAKTGCAWARVVGGRGACVCAVRVAAAHVRVCVRVLVGGGVCGVCCAYVRVMHACSRGRVRAHTGVVRACVRVC